MSTRSFQALGAALFVSSLALLLFVLFEGARERAANPADDAVRSEERVAVLGAVGALQEERKPVGEGGASSWTGTLPSVDAEAHEGDSGVTRQGSVEVTVVHSSTGEGIPGMVAWIKSSAGIRARHLEGRTDEEGVSRFHGLEPGHWLVGTTSGGLTDLELGRGADMEVRLELSEPRWTKQVLVVDDSSMPIEGAALWTSQFPNRVPELETGTTDESGRCDLIGWEGARWFGVRAAGYQPSVPILLSEQAPDRIMLVRSESSLHGLVTWADGTPVAEAGVFLTGSRAGEPDSAALWQRSETNAAGAYEFESVPSEPCVLRAAVFGSALWSRHVQVESGASMKLDIVLERGCGLTGTVTDPSGAGVAGVVVTVMEEGTGDLLWGVSDSSGGYQVQGLPSDQPVDVKATSKNLGDAHAVVRCQSGGGVEWSPVLGAPKEILVELVNGEGVSLSGLGVFLMRGDAIEMGEANENGVVSFDVLEGRSYRIEVRDARNAVLASRTILVEGHESLRIVVERGEASIAGSVRTREGAAAMGATVIVVRPDRQPTSPSVAVGEDGRFQVSGLHAGEHELVIVQPGFAIRRLVGLQVEPAGLLDVGLVELSVARNIEVDLSASTGSELVVQAVSEDGRILRRWEGICENEASSITLARVANEDTFVRVHRGDGEQGPIDEVFVPASDGDVRVSLNAK